MHANIQKDGLLVRAAHEGWSHSNARVGHDYQHGGKVECVDGECFVPSIPLKAYACCIRGAKASNQLTLCGGVTTTNTAAAQGILGYASGAFVGEWTHFGHHARRHAVQALVMTQSG